MEKRDGKITISLKHRKSNEVELIVSDNGIGIPEDLDIRQTDSLGLKLILMLAEDQLESKLKLDRKYGTRFLIVFGM